MFDKTQERGSEKTIIFLGALMVFFLLLMSLSAFGQTTDNPQTALARNDGEKKSEPALKPVLVSYKEITVGTAADVVRSKLGKPETSDEQSLYYKFNDEESAQFMLDADKKVRIISMMYFDKNNKAPKATDIFGAETQVAPNTDGSIYHMVRYPDAGYVVVYSRTAGDDPMVVVTMQKI